MKLSKKSQAALDHLAKKSPIFLLLKALYKAGAPEKGK